MTIELKAKEVSGGNFIYLPKENRYFFVDHYDHIDNMVIFYSVIDYLNGINEETKKFHKDDIVIVVWDYKIEPNVILQEVKFFYIPNDFMSKNDAEKHRLEGRERVAKLKETIKNRE